MMRKHKTPPTGGGVSRGPDKFQNAAGFGLLTSRAGVHVSPPAEGQCHNTIQALGRVQEFFEKNVQCLAAGGYEVCGGFAAWIAALMEFWRHRTFSCSWDSFGEIAVRRLRIAIWSSARASTSLVLLRQ